MLGKEIVKEAKKYIGKKISGQSIDGLSFVAKVYLKVTGKKLPSSIEALINLGKKVTKKEIKEGDLIFPNTKSVGIYDGYGRYIFIDNEGIVKMSNANSYYTGKKIF